MTDDSQLAPHSQEAEEALLGAVLLNPDRFSELAQTVTGDSFFILRNAWVWEAMASLHERGLDIDNVSVRETLKSAGRLDEIGGGAYLTYLINNTPTSLHADVYGVLIKELAFKRSGVTLATDIARVATDPGATAQELADFIAERTIELSQQRTSHESGTLGTGLADLVEHMALIESLPPGVYPGHATGLTDLDDLLQGLKPEHMYVFAAEPGWGKSALALQVAVNVASSPLHPIIGRNNVFFFSTEMSGPELAKRALVRHLKVNSHELHKVPHGTRNAAINALSKLPLYILPADGLTIEAIQQQAAVSALAYGPPGLIIIDHLQDINAARRFDKRHEEVAYMTRLIKRMAGASRTDRYAFNCPVLLLQHLTRGGAQMAEPNMHVLAESAATARSAHCVFFGYYRTESDQMRNVATFKIEKHRGGPTGKRDVLYRPAQYSFFNLARIDE